MMCFAIYRLPHANQCVLVKQHSGTPLQFRSCTELNGRQGFVVAPFQVIDQHPILLIQPDSVSVLPVEQPQHQSSGMHEVVNHRTEYAVDFANFHAQLEQDAFTKIVLARQMVVHTQQNVDPMQLFWDACARYPRLFIALVSMPDGTCWLTATPEILLEGVGTHWRTIALAGTMQLQGTDLQGEGENIAWSPKNIQEQRYVATYIAQCLERFNVTFKEEGPCTARAADLVHLRSDFTFTLLNNARVGDLLQELHPTPAVCGLPKREAFDFIVKNEHTPRQYYSGFMGPLNVQCTMNNEQCTMDNEQCTMDNELSTHLYVSLRCMQLLPNECRLYAGGGLLKESDLEQEWQETEAKMHTMLNLL